MAKAESAGVGINMSKKFPEEMCTPANRVYLCIEVSYEEFNKI